MIKVYKKRNPNLKGEEFIDNHFKALLQNAIFTSNLGNGNKYIANALIYKNIGYNKCEDCSDKSNDIYYDECKCEWCEDCHYNYCTCNLDSFEKLHNYIIDLVIKYLNKKQILGFINFLIRNNDYSRFTKYIKKLNDFTTKVK